MPDGNLQQVAEADCWEHPRVQTHPTTQLRIVDPAPMDLSTVVRYYVDKALKEVPGMKVLLLDAETTKIVSTVYSQSEILEQEVYLVERLDVERKEQLLHLKVTSHTSSLYHA